MDYLIEKAGWRDFLDLYHLEKVVFEQDAWPWFDLLVVLIFPGFVRLKAVSNGHMIGFVAGELRRGDGAGWVVTLGVLPEYRRKGIGHALLRQCEYQLNSKRIRLCVRKSNLPALKLYQQEGYVIYTTWLNYYHGGEDALVLEKILPN
ncbi:GNAT family N-acetyltransferase [Bellilinea sp.]|uniref:GNAT family N-acetyltransferase n=1 Tax=Bellilinea sp. TaxID=2838785 RepID=UPI002ADD87F9|nr:GNAT family N-acetyltransferase [Bellilinea sp.]